jgi:hypothetical protein
MYCSLLKQLTFVQLYYLDIKSATEASSSDKFVALVRDDSADMVL